MSCDLGHDGPVTSSTRLLRLLALLPGRPVWTGAELAERLGVTARTLRRDVTRLRDLGYPVHAEPGPAGGYRWRRGEALPPLLLDDDEAVAVTLALRSAAGGSVPGSEAAGVTALAKLQQVLPAALAARVGAVDEATVRLPGPALDAIGTDVLLVLAQACRERTAARITYTTASGTGIEREVEPLRIVHAGRRWYLAAFDVDRSGWRTFRLDRVATARGTARRFHHDDPPDPLELVAHGSSMGPYELRVLARLDVAPEVAREHVPRTVGRVLDDPDPPGDGDSCLLELGGASAGWVVRYLAGLPVGWEVLEPPEVREEAVAAAGRVLARHRGPAPPPPAGPRPRVTG
jgi:predicted DNA-binding transcriptional regulator YafY